MDAAALLKSQGWRGKGFSLHPTDNKIGLAKPLLLSRNTDGRGVGTKPHYTSDQWWLHAFDEKLKGLDTTSVKGAVVQTVKSGKLDHVVTSASRGKYAGLYASFVRGETMVGTMDALVLSSPDAEESTTTTTDATATPVSDGGESDQRRRRERPRIHKEEETKEERRARRAARRLKKEERAARKAAAAVAAKAARKEAKSAGKTAETKEERRARRAERRARKEARRKREVSIRAAGG
ncbi:hypothetical protein QBC47DRAFT_213224 [Echria macrotheca]|uniref:G-patch domain-containing protein n=1 Tax=Echria macrotheca TaxID=438768 RepID=A0AAJ0FBE8_9PEZI|nr:hypothetical protein QBC47DRAFT_213224 [Echria macrotheca]